jgi:hypothetical protein
MAPVNTSITGDRIQRKETQFLGTFEVILELLFRPLTKELASSIARILHNLNPDGHSLLGLHQMRRRKKKEKVDTDERENKRSWDFFFFKKMETSLIP